MLARSSSPAQRVVVFFVAASLLAGAAFSLHIWLAARRALSEGVQLAAAAGQAGVDVATLRPAATRFEPVLTAPEFESAVQFSGDIYVCGRSALFEYSGSELKKTWYAGHELPAAPLRSLAVCTGTGQPELWIATDGAGVLIFDGSTFRQFLPEKPALRKISAMLPWTSGRVLLGTSTAGLYLTDGKSLRVFHPQFAGTHVTTLAGDEDQFWIGTQADGAWLWRGGEALHVSAELPDAQVLSLASDGEQAWIGTALGVTEFRNGRLTRRLADGVFAQALAAQNGKLYVGTVDQGVFVFPLSTQKPRHQASALPGDTDSIASFARLGRTQLAVERRKLIDLEARKPLIDVSRGVLAGGHITAVHEDSRGRLWVGYFDGGIDILPAASGPITHLEDDVIFCVNRIKESPQDNSVLAATANGLAVFDAGGKLRQMLTATDGLISSNVTDVLFPAADRTGSSMVVATPAGLSFFDRGSIASVYAFQGLVNNHVYTLASWDGTLYAGTLGGLSSLRQGLVQASYNTGNSQLRQNWITASAVFANHLYLGTYGSGVVRFENGSAIQTFPAFERHRVEVNLNALLATDRALYAGTAGQGLAILRPGEERWQFISQGLPSLNVTALDERGGRLYVATDNGLARISENDLLP